MRIIKKLRKIEKECNQNPVLEKRLEPYAQEMMKRNMPEFTAKEFIKEYQIAKKELRL